MAHVALTRVAHLAEGESVLVHGALGGFAAAFPGIARQLGASRVVGTVRAGKLAAASATRLPYDQVVDSTGLPHALSGQKFDVVIDPVGGALRSHSLALMAPGGRLLAAEVDVLPFAQAVTAHQRMESRDLNGRIALTPDLPAA